MRASAPRGSIDLYLGLGSNQGDRRGQLAWAVKQLGSLEDGTLLAVSSLYESEFIGPEPQPAYLNACVRVATTTEPAEWLRRCQRLERRSGRAPDSHLRPRPLDIDLLLYGSLVVQRPDLVIPHPRILSRRFVLEPLAELAPDLVLPGRERPLRTELLRREIQSQSLSRQSGPDWAGDPRSWAARAGGAPS